jgi:hypothetical protein
MSELSVTKISGISEFSGTAITTYFDKSNTALEVANSVSGTASASFNAANNAVATSTAAFSKANNSLQTGMIVDKLWTSGDPNPEGFLRLDGNIYQRSAYSDLAQVIGTPLLVNNYTTLYTNNSMLNGDIYEANGVIFHNGTAPTNSALPTIANSLLYSTDKGINWNFAAAQGLTGSNQETTANAHTGFTVISNRIASNGRGTFILTNETSEGPGYVLNLGSGSGAPGTSQIGNAYIMISTSGLSNWSKVVMSGTTGGDTAFSGANGATIPAVAFGGTQNRFVALMNGGRANTFTNGVYNSRIGWSNNGSTWTFQSSNATVGVISGLDRSNPSIGYRYRDVVGSSNGFIAITSATSRENANAVFTSADGITWTDISSTIASLSNFGGATDRARSISHANGEFIILTTLPTGQFDIHRSTDRVTWQTISEVSILFSGSTFRPKILHNGRFYYTVRGQNAGIAFSENLTNWFAISSFTTLGSSSFALFPTANVGNTIFGQGTLGGSFTATINSVDHNTYNETTEFPLYSGFLSNYISVSPLLTGGKFIKT